MYGLEFARLLFMEFSRQEYWSGQPFPSPGDLPDPGIESTSLAPLALAGELFTSDATQKAHSWYSSLRSYFYLFSLKNCKPTEKLPE